MFFLHDRRRVSEWTRTAMTMVAEGDIVEGAINTQGWSLFRGLSRGRSYAEAVLKVQLRRLSAWALGAKADVVTAKTSGTTDTLLWHRLL